MTATEESKRFLELSKHNTNLTLTVWYQEQKPNKIVIFRSLQSNGMIYSEQKRTYRYFTQKKVAILQSVNGYMKDVVLW
jgi:hypothetical protein